VFSVFPLGYCLVVSTTAINCLERLVSVVYQMGRQTLHSVTREARCHVGSCHLKAFTSDWFSSWTVWQKLSSVTLSAK